MNRINKDEYYLKIAKSVASRSTCLKRQYGCVIVNNDEIIATGYNGSPRGEVNCCDLGFCKRLNQPHNSGNYDDCHSVHAEQNALISASRKDMIGGIMYLYGQEIAKEPLTASSNYTVEQKLEIEADPCPICKRMIQNAGIAKLISKGKCYVFN